MVIGEWSKEVELLVTSVFAGISRTILTEDRRTLTGYVRGLVLAIFTAIIAANALRAYGIDGGLLVALVAISAFCADDLLLGLLKCAKCLRDDPAAFFALLLKVFGLKKGK